MGETDNRTMIFGSVCSGIEAASVAWAPLGWRCGFVSEIEKFPSAVLRTRFPDVPNYGDMTKFKDWPDAAIDVLVGGTPCQSFSVAGLRKGLDDPRGNLALVYLGLAERYRPRWLVWENVPGVRSSLSHGAPDPCPPDIDLDGHDGPEDGFEVVVEDEYDSDESHAFACFLAGLSQLGYGWAYRSLDAQFAGLAQRRERVFVVAHPGDWRPAAAVLFEPESLRGDPAPSRKTGQGVAPTISARPTGGGGLGTDFDLDGGLINCTPDGIAGTVSSKWAKGAGGPAGDERYNLIAAPPITGNPYGDHESREGLRVAHALRGEGFDASEDGTGRGTPIVPVVAGAICRDSFSGGAGGGKPGQGYPAVAIQERAVSENLQNGPGGKGFQEGLAYTLEARNKVQMVSTPMAVRRLTPRECERLQGFPDDWTLIPYRGRPAEACPDGPRYKALGNSMAVPVMAWIGARIDLFEREVKP